MNKLVKNLLAAALVAPVFSVAALTPEPAPAQSQAIAIVGATVHQGNGNVIENAVVTFDGGKITFVGAAGDAPATDGHKVIDAAGKHVYPGLINPNSNLGLAEVDAVRASVDSRETGSLNPNIRALVAFNTDSELLPVTRRNGVLVAQVTPKGGSISGSSSIVNLDAWNWEDAAIRADDGLHMSWPSRKRRDWDWETFTVKTVENKQYQSQLQSMRSLFDAAVNYDADQGVNLKLAAMQPLLAGDANLFVHTNNPQEMVESVRFAHEYGIKKVVVVGGVGATEVAGFLVENNVPVILGPVHRVPFADYVNIDRPYRLPTLLSEAGVKVGMGNNSNMDARNLAFNAGTAAAYGLGKEAALQMVTLNNAEILGIADKLGSIETGKHATLFVSAGDALDMRTNNLTHAFIDGREVALDGMQEQLYERFHRKYASAE